MFLPQTPVVSLFGLGAPELMVVLIILLVLLSGYVRLGGSEGRARGGSDPGLTAHEKLVLLVVGAVMAAGIGIVVWPRIAH